MNKVAVLMSTYNGGKYVCEQIDSLLSQIDVELQIIIRDDGSSDNTVNLIQEYNSQKITLSQGSNLGFAQSFWSLLKNSPKADYYAFCDQDDIWFNDKLISAIRLIEDFHCPVLYTNDVIMIDQDKNIINENGFGATTVLSYADSLKRSILPGCTFVFNKSLRDALIRYSGFMISHDWTTYIIANAVGKVVFDKKPHMYYRIHSNNTIGFESKRRALVKKVKRFIDSKQIRTRSTVAKNVYQFYGDDLNEQKKKLTFNFANCSEDIKCAFGLMECREYRNVEFLFMLICRRI